MDTNSQLQIQWLGRVHYEEALKEQEALVVARREGSIPDTLLLLEHEPVFTIGRTRDRSSLINPEHLPYPVIETNRGGQATFHGPGQLVGYPILDLVNYGKDLHVYLRMLEEMLIDACATFDVNASLSEGQTGVWIGPKKVASIGVGVRKWVSMHGFAINVCGHQDGFDAIVPCGIQGVEMTSVDNESSCEVTMEQFKIAACAAFLKRFDKTETAPD